VPQRPVRSHRDVRIAIQTLIEQELVDCARHLEPEAVPRYLRTFLSQKVGEALEECFHELEGALKPSGDCE
jgi:hypothetical protein